MCQLAKNRIIEHEVRVASIGDIHGIYNLMLMFGKETPYFRGVEIDTGKLVNFITKFVSSDDSIAIVGIVDDEYAGFFFGIVSELFFSTSKVAEEKSFYVAPEYRGNGIAPVMIHEYETWAKSKGASLVYFL